MLSMTLMYSWAGGWLLGTVCTSAIWLLWYFLVWLPVQRNLRLELAAAQFAKAEADGSLAKATRELAQRAEIRLERALWDEYQKFVPQMQALGKFIDRNFPESVEAARLRVPPLSLLEVVQNLLVDIRERKGRAA